MKDFLVRRHKVLLSVLIAFLILHLLIPKPPLRDGLSTSTTYTDKSGKLLRLTLSQDEKYRLWLPLSSISPILIQATILKEDKFFWIHPGFNPFSLLRAIQSTYITRKRKIGGSTLTMQLVRIRHKIRTQTIKGKLKQILMALAVEWHYSKREILEAYLNLVPYGGNIEGIGAASLIYFSQNAGQLRLPEALTLAVIPQSPVRRSLHKPNQGAQAAEALKKARKQIFKQWSQKNPQELENETQVNLPLMMQTVASLPFEAPHQVASLSYLSGQRANVTSTLDLKKQKLLERRVRSYIDRKNSIGIQNASILLVDFRSMEIQAEVGSADFFNNDIEGQVNGTHAKRSPGSALKPFVYALSMEQGLIHPLTMLKDAPISFGGFNPENFDRDFAGPIKAKEALVRSRNVPAIYLASRLKEPGFYGFLKGASIDLPHGASYYGMAPVLGGAEVTMRELVKLYAMLANKGEMRDLVTLQSQGPTETKQVLSPEAAYLALDILKDNPRPNQHFRSHWTTDTLPVYWKTGTSYAFRDAWTVGIFGPYVLAVWVGNFNGEGNPAFVGAKAAAPLFFEIVDAIQSESSEVIDDLIHPPKNLILTDVCSVSGQELSSHCPQKSETWFIPGKSPIGVCEIHRQITIDPKTGLRVCSEDFPGAQKSVYEYWPTDLLKIFRVAGIPRRLPPPDHPSCNPGSQPNKGIPPKIVLPKKGITYHLRAASLSKEKLPFSAVSDADSREIFWFVNKDFVGKSRGDEPFLWSPRAGQFVVRAVDDRGRSDALEVKVVLRN